MAEKKLKRCVIIAGGPCKKIQYIKDNIFKDDYVICADLGYSYAQKLGITPDLVVGDFDSFTQEVNSNNIIKLNTHKDDTDTGYCVNLAVEKGFEEVIILSALGGRNDHSYGNFSLLDFLDSKKVKGKIVGENEIVELLSEGIYEFKNFEGITFSLFPFGCNQAVVSYYGKCEYPAENLTLNSYSTIGISNIFRSDNVKIQVKKGKALFFLETI